MASRCRRPEAARHRFSCRDAGLIEFASTRKGLRLIRKNPQVAAPRAHRIGEVATMRADGIWAKEILDVFFQVFLRSAAAGDLTPQHRDLMPEKSSPPELLGLHPGLCG